MPLHREHKYFSGKLYYLKDFAYNKVDAEQIVEGFRKRGYSARISKRTGKGFGYGLIPKYGIYVR